MDPQADSLRPRSPGSRARALIGSLVAGVAVIAAFSADITRITDSVAGIFGGDGLELIVDLGTARDETGDDSGVPVGAQHTVAYEQRRLPDALRIAWTSDYGEGLAGHVGILGEGPYFELPRVGLDLKLVNNGEATVFLTEAVVRVASSVADRRALLVLSQHPEVLDEIEFTNEGWGEPGDVRMLARIADAAEPDSAYGELPYRRLDNGTLRFDITPLLARRGLPVDLIERALALDWDDEERSELWRRIQPPCARMFGVSFHPDLDFGESDGTTREERLAAMSDEELAAFPFECEVDVEGRLEFLAAPGVGDGAPTRIDFETSVQVTPPEGLGAPSFAPTGSYDVELRTEGTDYTVSVPLSQPIEVGKPDRFMLWIGAPRSSFHVFTVELRYNDGESITTPPVHLSYLMPRGNRALLDMYAGVDSGW